MNGLYKHSEVISLDISLGITFSSSIFFLKYSLYFFLPSPSQVAPTDQMRAKINQGSIKVSTKAMFSSRMVSPWQSKIKCSYLSHVGKTLSPKLWHFRSTGYFRVAFCLCFKTSPGAQSFIWKGVSCQYERYCTRTRFEVKGNSEMAHFSVYDFFQLLHEARYANWYKLLTQIAKVLNSELILLCVFIDTIIKLFNYTKIVDSRSKCYNLLNTITSNQSKHISCILTEDRYGVTHFANVCTISLWRTLVHPQK